MQNDKLSSKAYTERNIKLSPKAYTEGTNIIALTKAHKSTNRKHKQKRQSFKDSKKEEKMADCYLSLSGCC